METTPRPTLLQAAKRFICKSAGTAVVVIAPLAAVSMLAPRAHAQTVFVGSGTWSGSTNSSFNSSSTYTETQLGVQNGFQGVLESTNGTATFAPSDSTSNFTLYGGTGSISGTALGSGITVPVGYDFTLSSTGSVVVTSWSLAASVGSAATANASGSGTGTFIGTTDAVTTTASNTFFTYNFYINYSGQMAGDTITLTMNPASSQGFSFGATAVPEPATYAAWLGLGALGLALVRRHRCAPADA
ncbi:MAG: PEP-CTERM sorting domain-containing protein [Opitutales bacterium]